MSRRELPPPMDELREKLLEAARREIAAQSSPPLRHRRRRGGLTLLFAVVGLATVAGAAELISIGEPVPDPKPSREGVRPGTDDGVIAVTAADDGQPLPWAVRVYEADGRQCALVGQLRGNSLGVVRQGVFHPYVSDTGGACGQLGQIPFFGSVRRFGGEAPRSLLFGRASAGVAKLRVRHQGRDFEARPERGGAFLFVFEGALNRRQLRLSALDARGRPVKP